MDPKVVKHYQESLPTRDRPTACYYCGAPLDGYYFDPQHKKYSLNEANACPWCVMLAQESLAVDLSQEVTVVGPAPTSDGDVVEAPRQLELGLWGNLDHDPTKETD